MGQGSWEQGACAQGMATNQMLLKTRHIMCLPICRHQGRTGRGGREGRVAAAPHVCRCSTHGRGGREHTEDKPKPAHAPGASPAPDRADTGQGPKCWVLAAGRPLGQGCGHRWPMARPHTESIR